MNMDMNLAASIAEFIRLELERRIKDVKYTASPRDLDSVQDVLYWMLRNTYKV